MAKLSPLEESLLNGNKKTLDHEDLPLLAINDSAYGASPTFRNKLESECGSVGRVTTLKLVKRHWMFRFQQVGVRMQSMLVEMIYAKGLTLSCQSKEGHSSGEIINLMTVDAARIGVSSIAAFAATVIVMLLNLPVASLQEKFQGKVMEFRDKRMKATSETLMNMRILKLQAWEMKFLSKIIQLRKTEGTWLKKFLVGIPLESGKILFALATF
ncbi:ABC transporter type 1, transmembrane domain [Sesbania bispinosa]|nr:ABC transporter type 1, transmembrane domain [Sesbania bispinosa]